MDSTIALNPWVQSFIASMVNQTFTLPKSLMYYIQKNYRPEIYEKLIQTCKYFFYSNDFTVVAEYYDDDNDKKMIGNWNQNNCCKLPLPNGLDSLNQKLWIALWLSIISKQAPAAETFYPLDIIPETIRCDCIHMLCFMNQNLKYKELEALSRSGTFKNVNFIYCKIFDENNDETSLETILALFHFLDTFAIISDRALPCSSKTAKTLADNPNLSKLKHFHLSGIPATLDIDDFMTFVKKHDSCCYVIKFSLLDTTAEYRLTFKNAAKEVCNNWDPKTKAPGFGYLGLQ